MELWMSSETQYDILHPSIIARNAVKKVVNTIIRTREYNLPLNSWDVIFILKESTDLEEIIEYDPEEEEMDFRLRIDYKTFKEADEKMRESMIFAQLQRSVELLGEFGLNEEGLGLLKADLVAIGIHEHWIEAGHPEE